MSQTFAQINKQIHALQKQAAEVRAREVVDVIDKMKHAISVYGITARDLGLDAKPEFVAAGAAPQTAQAGLPARVKGKPGPKVGFRAKDQSAKPVKASSSLRLPKYRDEAGNTWIGLGQRPEWLRLALAAGRQIEEFLIGKPAATSKAKSTPTATPASSEMAAATTTGRRSVAKPKKAKTKVAKKLATGTPAAEKAPPKTKPEPKNPPRYRDPATGKTWSGTGARPAWFRALIAQGRSHEDLSIQGPKG